MAKRTTHRSSKGTKLYAVRNKKGQFKDIQTYKRAHAADLRQKSTAETVAAQGPIEKKVRKAATDAVRSVKRSVKDAVAAVQRAAKRAVKQVSNPQPAGKKAAAATGKTARTPATKKAVPKTAKKKAAKPAAKKTARKAAKTK